MIEYIETKYMVTAMYTRKYFIIDTNTNMSNAQKSTNVINALLNKQNYKDKIYASFR